MPITYVGGKVGSIPGAASGNTTVDLSSGLTGGSNAGVSAGDLVLVAYGISSTGVVFGVINDPSAVVYPLSFPSNGNDNFDANLMMRGKFMPPTPDASVVLGPTGNVADSGAYTIQVWRGVSPTQTLDAAATSANGGNTARPDPPSIAPVTTGTFVVAAVAGAAADMSVAFTFASVSNFIQATQAGTNDIRVGMMSVAWVSGVTNIAASTTGSATTSDSWAAVAIALREAGREKSHVPTSSVQQNHQHLLVR